MANPVFSPIKPHFFQPLLPGFHRYLTIPLAFFLMHIKRRDNEPKAVELRSNGREGIWEVKMDGRRLTDGWKEFAVAHEFQVGGLVVFRHEGDMVFHVTAFGPSCCQIQFAPFHPDDDVIDFVDTGNLPRKKQVKKNPKTEADSSDHTCFIAAVTASGLHKDILLVPRSFARRNSLDNRHGEIVLKNGQGRSWTLVLRHKKSSGRAYIERGWRDFCRASGQKAGSFFRFKLVQNGAMPVLQLLESPKIEEKVTLSTKPSNNTSGESSKAKEKKTRSGWRVSSLPRQNRFLTLTLTPYSLKYSKMRIPKTFTRANGLDKPGQKITLQDKHGREWPSYLRREGRCGHVTLGKGWRSFIAANDVNKSESFTLEMIRRKTIPTLKFCSKVKIEQCG